MNDHLALQIVRKIVNAICAQEPDASATERQKRWYAIARRIQSILLEFGINEN